MLPAAASVLPSSSLEVVGPDLRCRWLVLVELGQELELPSELLIAALMLRGKFEMS
jgi:hypothetical protein